MRKKFELDRYVDFPQFRAMWISSIAKDATKPLQLRNSPELAWHAIRTFIKGRCPADGHEDDFGPDRYAELPKRQKSIDEDLFLQIYENIWRGWYKPRCDRERLWDDQDLALEVLRLEDGLACYPAVICDEAQDFTANELAVILRLSLFSERDVPHYKLGRIPFAFAGDPFQTLNPTGFDWNALSDTFRENLLRELDPAGRQKLQVNFKELEFNYRSAEPIVRLCNLVQLLRGILFEVRGLKPQQTWRNEMAAEPALFDIAEAATRDALRKAEDVVFIVPSQEESELDYVKIDDFLSQIALSNEELLRDVFNPMRAKGMEFGRVVIYKFGEYCLRHISSLPELLAQPKPQPKRDHDRLTHEYFLNRLYVALSRARNRLLIVDTSEAIEKFWRFARGQGYEDLISQYKSSEGAWGLVNLGMAVKGEFGAWHEETQDDSAEIGRQYFDQGYENRDPYMLERAANRFDRIKSESDALKARGWALHFRAEYAKAGKIFARIPDVTNALDNFWRAGEFSDYVNLARTKPDTIDPRFPAARYMGSHRQEEDARELFSTLHELLKKSDVVKPILDDRMRDVLTSAYKNLIAALNEAPDDERAQDTARKSGEHVDLVADRYNWKSSPSLGHAALKAVLGKDKEAADTWKALRRPEAEVPYVLTTALANTLSFPENLPYLRRIRAFDRLLEALRAGKESMLSVNEVVQIAVDLRATEDAKLLEKFAIAIPATKSFAVFNGIPVEELENDKTARDLLKKLITRLAETGALREFLECVVEHSVQDLDKNRGKWLASVVGSDPQLHHNAIRKLAAANIDRDGLDNRLRDLIAKYFETLLKEHDGVLRGTSPFEVGAVLELSGMFKLMHKFYESVLDMADQETDGAILSFARERLIVAQNGLAKVAKNPTMRKRIEEEATRLARTFMVNPSKSARFIKLHEFRQAIDKFYEKRKIFADTPETSFSIHQPLEAATLPSDKGNLVLQKKKIVTAVSDALIKSTAASIEPLPSHNQANEEVFSGQSDAYLQERSHSRKVDLITINIDEFLLEVNCNYDVHRIEIRDIKSRDTVVVKMKNNTLLVNSTDLNISRNEFGVYHLDGWPVTVELAEMQNDAVMIDVKVVSGGPWIRLEL